MGQSLEVTLLDDTADPDPEPSDWVFPTPVESLCAAVRDFLGEDEVKAALEDATAGSAAEPPDPVLLSLIETSRDLLRLATRQRFPGDPGYIDDGENDT